MAAEREGHRSIVLRGVVLARTEPAERIGRF
jgi:hypothetical protein